MRNSWHSLADAAARANKNRLSESRLSASGWRGKPPLARHGKREYKQFTRQSKGKCGGVGIHLGYDPATLNQLTVISPMVDTPAYDAGILAGDVILKIDGKSTEGMRLSEAVELIQGEPGE